MGLVLVQFGLLYNVCSIHIMTPWFRNRLPKVPLASSLRLAFLTRFKLKMLKELSKAVVCVCSINNTSYYYLN